MLRHFSAPCPPLLGERFINTHLPATRPCLHPRVHPRSHRAWLFRLISVGPVTSYQSRDEETAAASRSLHLILRAPSLARAVLQRASVPLSSVDLGSCQYPGKKRRSADSPPHRPRGSIRRSTSTTMRSVMLALVGSALVLGAHAGAVDLTGATFQAEAIDGGKAAFVKFFAPW
jgi:hypothetical protein